METFRAPKAVMEEVRENEKFLEKIAQPLTLEEVVEIRTTWQGDKGREWAAQIVDNQLQRAATIHIARAAVKENSMPDMNELPDLQEELTELLADVVSFYFRAHGAHWNVVGTDFAEYHALFNEIYEDVYGSIDPIAENLRKIGSQAPFTLPQFIALRSIDDSSLASSDAKILATDLLVANDAIIDGIAEAFDCATENNQQGIANFLADRLDKHQFWKWQLSSSIGIEVQNPTPAEPVEDVLEEGIENEEATLPMPIMGRSEEETVMLEERKTMIRSAEQITMTAEVRSVATDDGSIKIAGYAATFGNEATGLNFREVIAPGAFTRTLKSDQPVFLLINHDMEQLPLASTRSGTLKLSEDEIGLRMEAVLDPLNPRAAELASALGRGDVDKMSFAFTVAPGGDTRSEGLRTLTDLDLYEISVVNLPAYDDTSVGLRSEQAADDLNLRKRKLAAKFKQYSLTK